MALMMHPNDEAPERYRVFDKSLKVQQYFSIKKLGPKRAKKQAEAAEASIQQKLKNLRLIAELDINKIFTFEDVGGKESIVKIKGTQRMIVRSKGRADRDAISIQVRTELNTSKHITVYITAKRTFEEAYRVAQDRLLDALNIERTHELTMFFNKAKRNYW